MTTSMRTSHYEVLGAREDASPAELKTAYRAKVKALHPDSGGTEEAFEALQVAWSVISDPHKRREYDAWLEDTRPVLGGSRLAVQQRYEERELEAERRAWEVRREEARKKAAQAAAARAAAADAQRASAREHVDVQRHLMMGAAALAVLISLLELWRGPSQGGTEIEVFATMVPLPPTGTAMLVIQVIVGVLVAMGSVLLGAPAPSGSSGGDTSGGIAAVRSSSQFRFVVGLVAALLTIWVLVPFILRTV